MQHFIVGLSLFILQLLLSFRGSIWFGKTLNPWLLLLVSMAIPVYYFYLHLKTREHDIPDRKSAYEPLNWLWLGVGALAMFLGYEELRKMFVQFTPTSDYSDVVPQVEALYNRFREGVFPYQPVDMGTYQPFPVYMPLHWMPLFITDILNADSRWAGYILLVLASGMFSFHMIRKETALYLKIIIALLPSLALWAFILWGGMEIPVSYELNIAAYYLVLGIALYKRNVYWVLAGLILCILSRYTLAFWLPLFALLFWIYAPKKQSIITWGSVLAAFLLFYYIPFLSKEPEVLLKGVQYHNHAAVDEWKGYGDPPVSWSFERGIYFAPHMKAIFSGDMEQRVFKARVVQGSLMLLLFIGGFFLYRRWKDRIAWQHYSLGMLYAFMAVFYFFGPLTYRYYFIVLFMLSSVLVADIIQKKS